MESKITNIERAQTLVEALPYMQRYAGKTIVVKYGGNAMIDEQLRRQVMEDVALLSLAGVKVVLVHGGGPDINKLMNALGKQPEFVDGLRVTDKETIDIVEMVLAGKVNKDLVNLLSVQGAKAVGLSGIDGQLLIAKPKDARLGYVGTVTKVNIEPVTGLMEMGYVPVISTVACDEEGNIYNINGDTAAASIAGALKAERLLMLTDTSGVLMDKDDPSTLIPKLTIGEALKLKKDKIIAGGMIPKVECCIKALLELGVNSAIIMDGRVPHAILTELLTDGGAGTMFVKGE